MVLDSHKAHLAALFIMLIYAGNALISKVAMLKGMNPFVFAAYRQAFASLVIAPFAYFLESGKAPALSFSLLCKIFLVSLCGITSSLDLYYKGINYTSATFAAACTNAIPAITFILAVLLRVESVSIKQMHGMAKLFGTLIGVCGAMVFAFAKGPPLKLLNPPSAPDSRCNTTTDSIKGSFMILGANTFWSLWLILQGPLMKLYPLKLRLTALQCLFSCVQAAIIAIAMERNLSSWKLGWDVNLFSVAYCGVIVTGMTYWLQAWVIEKKGPVFLASFTPLSLVLTSIISTILWKETLYWGRIWGAILLVTGLYSVLWGKDREAKIRGESHDEEKLKQEESKEDTT